MRDACLSKKPHLLPTSRYNVRPSSEDASCSLCSTVHQDTTDNVACLCDKANGVRPFERGPIALIPLSTSPRQWRLVARTRPALLDTRMDHGDGVADQPTLKREVEVGARSMVNLILLILFILLILRSLLILLCLLLRASV